MITLKNNDIELQNVAYEKKQIDKGIAEILDKYSDKQHATLANTSVRGQIEKVTVMMQSFCFDQITQLKRKYKYIINDMKKDFCEEIESGMQMLANTSVESFKMKTEFQHQLKKANKVELDLRET